MHTFINISGALFLKKPIRPKKTLKFFNSYLSVGVLLGLLDVCTNIRNSNQVFSYIFIYPEFCFGVLFSELITEFRIMKFRPCLIVGK
jgi:hypothetical protein